MKQSTLRKLITLAMLAVLCIFFTAKNAVFMSAGNLTAILRDASGNIVGGGINYLSSHPAEGSSMPFEVPVFEQVDYATCEVHALAW